MVRFPGENHELSRSGTPSRRIQRLQHYHEVVRQVADGQVHQGLRRMSDALARCVTTTCCASPGLPIHASRLTAHASRSRGCGWMPRPMPTAPRSAGRGAGRSGRSGRPRACARSRSAPRRRSRAGRRTAGCWRSCAARGRKGEKSKEPPQSSSCRLRAARRGGLARSRKGRPSPRGRRMESASRF